MSWFILQVHYSVVPLPVFFVPLTKWLPMVCVNSLSAAAYPFSLGRGGRKAVIFQCESSVLLVHGEVAIIHFKNSILQLKHYLSVMGAGILSIAKLKLSITLIKSTAVNTRAHVYAHTRTKDHQTFLLCGADFFILTQKDSQSRSHLRAEHQGRYAASRSRLGLYS